MKKQIKVNCEVENCKNNEENRCCLDELDIGCITDDCSEVEETICNSFEKNDFDDDCREIEYDELEEDEEDEFEEDEEYIKIEEEF